MRPLLCLIFLCITLNLNGQNIERIEPSNWWVGMKWNEVSILIYGKNIQEYHPQIDYAGITINSIEKPENTNYLFIDISISPETIPGIATIEFIQGQQTKAEREFPIYKREPNSKFRQGFTPADAIYLITPDRFANGDTANDSQSSMKEIKINREDPNARHGGDIRGITNHLDYIKNLGFTYIWPTPMIENDMPEYSYHGYATTDFYTIDKRFGTNEDYKNMVKIASQKGIGVIKDVVLNHVGSEHWFYKDPPYSNWINHIKKDVYIQTNHNKLSLVSPYAATIDKKEYTDGWFVETMPDLNQRHPRMQKYLIQNNIWWLEYAGINGIRVDTYSYSDKDFLSKWSKALTTEYNNLNIVGEEWIDNPSFVSYWQAGQENFDGYKSYLPSVMDFNLGISIKEALNTKNNWSSSWKTVYESFAMDYLFANPMNQMIFADNHDMDRVFSQLQNNEAHYRLFITAVMTMRGIPQIYYGTEILSTNEDTGNHGQIRSDFLGGWENESTNAFTGKGLSQSQINAQNFIKTLANWRKNNPELMMGSFTMYVPQLNDCLVYFRKAEQKQIMVILNKSNSTAILDPSRYEESLQGKRIGIDVFSNHKINFSNHITIPAKTAYLIEIY